MTSTDNMNTTDYLLYSDIASGVVALVFSKLQGNNSNSLWKPFIESVTYSILGRMAEKKLDYTKTDKSSYIRTAEGRSSIVVFIASMIYSYIMKNNKNKWMHSSTAVSSDVLGNEITGAIFAKDSVIYSAGKST